MLLNSINAEKFSARRTKAAWCFVFLSLVLFASLFLSISYGAVDIPPSDVYSMIMLHLKEIIGLSPSTQAQGALDVIVWQMRVPRAVMAVLSGGIFAVSGIFMQTLTQNPIADPYILGISAGASTGSVCAIIFNIFSFIPFYAIQVSAFLGAALALILVLLMTGRRPTPLRLVLLGVGVSSFFTAVTAFVLQKAHNNSQLQSAMFWMLGSFSAVNWEDIFPTIVLLTLSLVIASLLSKELDALLLGDLSAENIGVPIWRVKTIIALCSTLIVAVVVSKVGIIGFIGLIVPHAARKFCGARHNLLVPSAALAGGIFMIWADTLARTLFSPEEIPVGILTAITGAPVFIWIVQRGYSFGGRQ